MRRRVPSLIGLALVASTGLGLAACGGDAPSTTAAAAVSQATTEVPGGVCAPSGGTPAVCYTVAIHGAIALAGATATPAVDATSCAGLASAVPFRLPAFPPALAGGATLAIDLRVLRSTGPGSYRDAAVTGQSGPFVLFVRHEPWSTFGHASSVVVTVSADGSGTLAFTGLARTSDSTLAPPVPTMDGTISWRCVER